MADEIFGRLKSALADRYRLDRLLGQGGMATVYLAEDLKHHRQVAIKVLRPDLSAALGADRFLREIELAAKLQHPHIVPVYDSGNADGILYYVMPFVEGESLRDMLQREKRIPLERAADIVRAAASGLAYAHAQGIVHRDVKPENIMMSGGLAVVTDFGIARAIDASRNVDANLTGVGMAMGTPAYMSPEQATADVIDGRTDQYALACVFYEMVSGQQAFSAPTMQAMIASILTAPRPKISTSLKTIPPEVDVATQRALATDPSKRFESISAFADAVSQESSGAARATRESRFWKKVGMASPVIAAIIAAVYVTVFAGPKRTVVSGAETIAVVPFTTSGPGLDKMDEGMVDLLARQLDGVGSIHTIESRTVLQKWKKQVEDGDVGVTGAIAVAKASKAASVLTGSIVSSAGKVRLTAELYDLEGKQLANAAVDGPADSLIVLADNLGLKILHAIWSLHDPLPSANTAAIASNSMTAIKAYLKGESFHRRGQWDSAKVAFTQAVEADSTFALAWYRLANTLGWMGNYRSAPMLAAAANAERYADSLPKRLRALMVAYHLFAQGSVAAVDSAVVYTRQYPDDADGWFLLGESQYHTNTYHPLSPAALRAPFDKVLSIDSSLTPAAIHPMELALQADDVALLQRYESVFRSGGDSTDLARIRGGREALDGSDESLANLASGKLGAGATRAIVAALLNRPTLTGDSVNRIAQALLHNKSANPNLVLGFQVLGGQVIGGLGRVTQGVKEVTPFNTPSIPFTQILRSYPLVMGFATPDTLRAFKAVLDTVTIFSDQMRVNLTHSRAAIALDLGHPEQVAALVKPILAMPDSIANPGQKGIARAFEGLAMIAMGDTLHGLARVDSAMRSASELNSSWAIGVGLRYAQVQLAMPELRTQGILRLQYGFVANPDLIPVNTLRIAKAYEAAGFPDSSAAYYRRFLRLFDKADINFAPMIESAKEGLARVTGDKPATKSVGGKP